MINILDKIRNTIEKYGMIDPGSTIIAGVSGGPDSMCMLHSLRALSKTQGSPAESCRIIVVHVNHNIRGKESDDDRKFVERFCKEAGVECVVINVNACEEAERSGEGLEEAARRLRYNAFIGTAAETGAKRIAVAHNMNDQAETVLMRIMRGTGVKGLAGMAHVRKIGSIGPSERAAGDIRIIRPVLDLKRAEIEEYCSLNGLETRTDSTNLSDAYTRNRIRLKLIPYMESEFNPNVTEALVRLASQAGEYEERISEEAALFVDPRWDQERKYLELRGFESLSAAVAAKALTMCLERAGLAKNIYSRGLDRLMELALSPAEHREADIAEGVFVRRSYKKLWFTRRDKKTEEAPCELYVPFPMKELESGGPINIELGDGRTLTIKKYKNDNNNHLKDKILLDYDKLRSASSAGTVVFRNRRPGDRIRLKGMKGRKKLQDLFVDRKVPKTERDSVLLTAVGSSIISAGREVSAEYRINEATQWIISIEY